MEPTFLQMIMDVLERVHPNRFEIIKLTGKQPENLGGYARLSLTKTSFRILIHYPEIYITNNFKHKHKIRDLFVVLTFNDQYLNDVEGFRSTQTFREHTSLYQHSHLHMTKGGKMSQFCLGDDGSHFNDIVRTLNNTIPDEILFEHFIRSLDEFVSWESIEGVPYIPMIKIDYREYSGSVTFDELPDDFKEELYNCIKVIKNDRYKYLDLHIKPSEKLVELTPEKYKRIKFRDKLYLKKTELMEAESERSFLHTNVFNKKFKVIATTEDTEGILGSQFGTSAEFLDGVKIKLLKEFNNLVLWKK